MFSYIDGCLPSNHSTGTPAEMEERRLFYVAMTAAKDALQLLTMTLRFYTHGQIARGDKHAHPSTSEPGGIAGSKHAAGAPIQPNAANR